jgi:hypothetical protein
MTVAKRMTHFKVPTVTATTNLPVLKPTIFADVLIQHVLIQLFREFTINNTVQVTDCNIWT